VCISLDLPVHGGFRVGRIFGSILGQPNIRKLGKKKLLEAEIYFDLNCNKLDLGAPNKTFIIIFGKKDLNVSKASKLCKFLKENETQNIQGRL
jgi:hypothetical protein